MRTFLSVVLTLAAGLFATPAASLAQTVWSIATDYPQDSMPGLGLTTFADALARTSSGRMNVKPGFDGVAGIKPAETLAAIGSGRLVAGDMFGGVAGDTDPLFLLSSLPFLTASVADAKRLFEAALPAYEAALETRGQRLLYVTPWPPSGIWAKQPIHDPSDLSGLRIRTYDATSAALMNALGARATSISFSEAMPAIRDGSIVAVLSSGDGGAGRRLWEFMPVYTSIQYAVPLSFTTLNKATWDALDGPSRDAVARAAAETQAAQWAALATRLARNEATMRANGVTIVADVSPALRRRLSEAAATAIADWKGRTQPAGPRILDRFQSTGK